MKKTIYKYSLENGESTISQGDIFRNLPYFSYDYFIRLDPNNIYKFENEKSEIFEDIIQNGSKVQIEGFFYPKWGILASQDCDIKPNKDLIFYPLKETKCLIDEDNILKSIDNQIINTTRRLYIPKLGPPHTEAYGPYEIIFHNPFNVPFEAIINNLSNCWKARIIEPARKIFVGKLTQFYSRTPVEEIIFLENEEITKYMITNWDAFWKKGKTIEEFRIKLKKIEQILDILVHVDRKDDLEEIFYFDLQLIDKIKDLISKVKWFKNSEDLIKLCNYISDNYDKKPKEANSQFEELINSFIIEENSFLNQFDLFIERKLEKIKEIRRYGKPHYKKYAIDTLKARELRKNIPDFLKEYRLIYRVLRTKIV